jgi:hypothetical protein
MDVRNLIAAIVVVFVSVQTFAQTQPTRPSAYATAPTMPFALATGALNPCYPSSSFNRTSPCYSGTNYPSYSAAPPPFEFPRSPSLRPDLQGANSLDETQAKQRIEAKGYSKISGLRKDNRGIWHADATLRDGRRVEVILDLEGNIYSELVPSVEIWMRPPGN